MVQDNHLVGSGEGLGVVSWPLIGQKGRMRLGDYVLCLSMTLIGSMTILYAYQGHWSQAGYWFAALQLNYWLMGMK